MSSPEQRAAERRASWTGQIVQSGQDKGLLYDALSPEQRLGALARLNERVWRALGCSLPTEARSQWPGQIFEIKPRD